MKTLKKSMSIVLALIMLLSVAAIAPFSVNAAETDYSYALLSEGGVIVTDYHGVEKNVVIPDTLGGYPVKIIGESAFENMSSIETVTFPENVIQIDTYAFYMCENLNTVTFSSTLQSVGNSAFYGCESLADVNFSDSVTTIYQNAFNSCINLESVTFGKGMKTVGKGAFQFCDNLTDVYFPVGINKINAEAFSDCPNIGFFGYKGTEAEFYAYKNKIPFESQGTGAKMTKITLKKTSAKIRVKGKVTIKATIKYPLGKTTYKSKNTKIAKVSAKGVVTGVKKGTTKIVVKNHGVSKTFKVTVK